MALSAQKQLSSPCPRGGLPCVSGLLDLGSFELLWNLLTSWKSLLVLRLPSCLRPGAFKLPFHSLTPKSPTTAGSSRRQLYAPWVRGLAQALPNTSANAVRSVGEGGESYGHTASPVMLQAFPAAAPAGILWAEREITFTKVICRNSFSA